MTDDFIAFDTVSQAESSKPVKRDRVRVPRTNTTLFVSSLPYTATSTDLTTHFSFLGPVRHGFIATDKDSGKSKGVGYVTYSLKEDAERAVQELDGGEFGDKGRKIRVVWADERPAPKERQELVDVPKPKKEPVDDSPKDPNAIRTLVLTGVPSDITKAVLWKRVRKVHDKVELNYPIEGEDSAHLVFPSHGDALKAGPKLHGHTYKGSILSCVLKKRLEKLTTTDKGPSHAGRLIVRNLAWDTTEQDLRSAFLPYGPVHSIDLPTAPSKLPRSSDPSKPDPPPRARGFAFVWFLTRKDAEQAMEALNGKIIPKAAAAKGKGKSKDAEGRPVAVDWALSKDQWEKAQKSDGGKEEKGEEEEESGFPSDSEGSASHNDSDESDDSDGSDDEPDEERQDGDKDGDVDMEEPIKPSLPTVDVGSTLFVRNLPFEVTEQELNTLFRSFGPLRYARITIDKATGRSRGTGFVCFWKIEHADAAITEAEKVAQESGANAMPLGGGSNPFALPSILTADPSSSLASQLVLHGRTLEVSRAVTREEAGRMKEDGERARNAGDKRNTYLMREGVVYPNSPAAASLPEAEVEKRQSSFNARRALLRSNPSLYISKTRLSIRQLPLFITDRALKRLAIHAVRTFDDEMKAGTREGLTKAEEVDDTLSPALAAKKSKKRGERETAVIQSKVVRQSEKLDPLTGQGRSKGYGFLEMRSHKDALKVLRWANNNAAIGALVSEWWKGEMGEILERTKKSLEVAREEKKEVEELEARVKRLEARLMEKESKDGGMRGGKTLMIEFSIENVQVVRRRVEKISAVMGDLAERGKKRKVQAAEDSEDDQQQEPITTKRPRQGKGDYERKEHNRQNDSGGKKGGKREGGKREGGKPGGGKKEGASREGGKEEIRKVPENRPTTEATEEKRGLEKLGSHLGSLIGRKRKMRKGK